MYIGKLTLELTLALSLADLAAEPAIATRLESAIAGLCGLGIDRVAVVATSLLRAEPPPPRPPPSPPPSPPPTRRRLLLLLPTPASPTVAGGGSAGLSRPADGLAAGADTGSGHWGADTEARPAAGAAAEGSADTGSEHWGEETGSGHWGGVAVPVRRMMLSTNARAILSIEVRPRQADADAKERSDAQTVADAFEKLLELTIANVQDAANARAVAVGGSSAAILKLEFLSLPPPSPPSAPPLRLKGAEDDTDFEYTAPVLSVTPTIALLVSTLFISCFAALFVIVILVLQKRSKGGSCCGFPVYTEHERHAAASIVQAVARGRMVRQAKSLQPLRTQRDEVAEVRDLADGKVNDRDAREKARDRPRYPRPYDPFGLYNRFIWRPAEEHV